MRAFYFLNFGVLFENENALGLGYGRIYPNLALDASYNRVTRGGGQRLADLIFGFFSGFMKLDFLLDALTFQLGLKF